MALSGEDKRRLAEIEADGPDAADVRWLIARLRDAEAENEKLRANAGNLVAVKPSREPTIQDVIDGAKTMRRLKEPKTC